MDLNDHDIPADESGTEISGGGPTDAAAAAANDPVARAVAHLELLSEPAREQVLAKLSPQIADRIRTRLKSTPDRPHGTFSSDIAERRRMAREMAERIHAHKTAEMDQQTARSARATARPDLVSGQPAGPTGMPGEVPAGPVDPLDTLRTLHPAAIARAMQGERAEAWSIVLDRLDDMSRGALTMYLDEHAQHAIADARSRQADLGTSSPVLVRTIEAAIARTVVPRAMREHQQLLSTTPMTWAGESGAIA